MRFDVVTLFPEMMEALAAGVIGRAQKQGLISLHCWNPRDIRTMCTKPWMTDLTVAAREWS